MNARIISLTLEDRVHETSLTPPHFTGVSVSSQRRERSCQFVFKRNELGTVLTVFFVLNFITLTRISKYFIRINIFQPTVSDVVRTVSTKSGTVVMDDITVEVHVLDDCMKSIYLSPINQVTVIADNIVPQKGYYDFAPVIISIYVMKRTFKE